MQGKRIQKGNGYKGLLPALALLLALTLTGCTATNQATETAGGATAPTSAPSATPTETPADTRTEAPAEPSAPTPQAQAGPPAPSRDLVIPVAGVSEQASFYPVNVEGTQMEIIAVKTADGALRTAFNTCQVCYGSGRGYYVQQGDRLVCQNCGNQFPMGRVEVEAGGCNPWPIFAENKTVTDESITISYDFLKQAKVIFSNWKVEY
ncbi:MAG: Fe-S-containing protein [Oscillospiraceae bacterium]|nr:Fe-S-containing protein [Oscillospiraceae bacterium]